MRNNKCERVWWAVGVGCTIILTLITLNGIVFGAEKGEARFPNKSVTLIVPFPAASGLDSDARFLSLYAQKYLGVSIVLQNIPGANGKIGLNKLYNISPDGYTIGTSSVEMSMLTELISKTEYKFLEFTPIFAYAIDSQVLLVSSETWKGYEDFIKDAQSRTLSAGVPGHGAVSHFQSVILVDKLGLKVNWVPFEGGNEAATALAGKHIDFCTTASRTAIPLVRAGRLKPILVFAENRESMYPQTPCLTDLKLDIPPVFISRGIYGPPKMSQDKVNIIQAAYEKAVKDPEFQEGAKKRQMTVISVPGAEWEVSLKNFYLMAGRYIKFLQK